MEVYPPELDSDFVEYVWWGESPVLSLRRITKDHTTAFIGHWLGAMRLLDDAFYCIG